MRLSVEIVEAAPIIFNALKERTLILRGLGVVGVENLGTCNDQVECIDLSDNEIFKVENFPHLAKVKSIILANNKISAIADMLGENLPNLVSLVLTNNRITNIDQMANLKSFRKLERISLAGNPVVEIDKDYARKLKQMIPTLRFVDSENI
jgi:U2 small nuclear ribonucleoprotein A'